MTDRIFSLIVAVLLGNGCAQIEAVDLAGRAQQIAESSVIIDTHVDVPYRLNDIPADISNATEDGDFDYPRAVAGGLNVPFMSIYTPAELESEGRSKGVADSLITMVEGIVENAPDKFAIARSVADVKQQFGSGLVSLPLGMENEPTGHHGRRQSCLG